MILTVTSDPAREMTYGVASLPHRLGHSCAGRPLGDCRPPRALRRREIFENHDELELLLILDIHQPEGALHAPRPD